MNERINKLKEKMRVEHSSKQHAKEKSNEQDDRSKTNEVIKKPENEKVQEAIPTLGRKFLAEFMGTFFFVFAGTGAVILNFITGELTHFGVSLTFGLAFMLAIYTYGHISGAHINPAITIGFLIRKDINFIEAMTYIMSQMLGAIGASFALYLMFGQVLYLGATLPIGTPLQTFGLEFLLTFFLMMVVLGTVYGKHSKLHAGISIGAVVFFATFFGTSLTGASMNPARSIGPAMISGATDGLWIYIVAPILGAIVATIISKFMNE